MRAILQLIPVFLLGALWADPIITNQANTEFLLPSDFRSVDESRRAALVSSNASVFTLNGTFDTNEVCRIWSVGGETKVTEFLGHTNLYGAQYTFGQLLKESVLTQAILSAEYMSQSLSNSYFTIFSNTLQLGSSVITNMPTLPLLTNGLGLFGTNVNAGWIGSGTNATPYDVSAIMGGYFHGWHDRISGWAHSAGAWLVRIMVGLFFGWSLYDMVQRFMSTKPGSHSLAGSQYATFSAAWLATATFWGIILVFMAAITTIHMTAFSAYYQTSAVDWSSFWGPINTDINTGPTNSIHVASVGQAISGFTGQAATGSLGNSVRLVWTWFVMWVPVGELVRGGVAVCSFWILRQFFYNISVKIAAVVAGAL